MAEPHGAWQGLVVHGLVVHGLVLHGLVLPVLVHPGYTTCAAHRGHTVD